MTTPGSENTTDESRVEVDILLVGAGPTGLYGAYYAGFRGLRTAVVDALPQVGGQVMAMYPEKPIFDIAGLPAVKGRTLVDNLVAQAAPFEPLYLLGRQATTLHYEEDRLIVRTTNGLEIRTRAVIITGGLGTFTPRPMTVAERYEGSGLVYFVRRPEDYQDRDVVIVGGGDSAFDWAATLEPLARSVTLVHRRDRFRAHRATVDAVRTSSVRLLVNCEVTEVLGDSSIEEIRVKNVQDGTVHDIRAQVLVASLGFTADLGPLGEWGLTMNARHLIVDTRMATNRPRVYAAGDITEYVGKVRLISVGFGEAATAVNNAATEIDPQADLFPGHSTDSLVHN
ncbi:NAD(P)/FAD-dependent oxidoreductase [Embleya scabrispora]|uniref:NAD(P)/FAD-dependent oxidoreductase n=1 Tax=Embleya scabrispora TaxID=159449 RepID=UPI0006906232|nr:NAD(P)/FAD-dependent oxidoreductase [Embleya scabrispora]MYS85136.1 FAD-dependent oxidoreductase [Streptomyces sp. SID5474]